MKLAIVGRGRHWQHAFKDAARDVWAVSSVFPRLPRAHKIFNIHAPNRWEPWLEKFKAKLVIAHDADGFEDCERLPVSELVELHGRSFHSSISWMLAYGAFMGYTDIGLYGIDMFAKQEFLDQRDSLYFLWGHLTAIGVAVFAPEGNGIAFPNYLYGVEE